MWTVIKSSFHTHKIIFWLFLKMKGAGSYHTLVTNFPSMQRHISQDVNCHQVIISHTKSSFDSSWRWREQVPPKHWLLISPLRSITSHKTLTVIKSSFHAHKIIFWLFLKMKKVAGSSHTLVTNFHSTQRHISQDVNCHQVIISHTQNHLLTLPEDEGSRLLPHIGYWFPLYAASHLTRR